MDIFLVFNFQEVGSQLHANAISHGCSVPYYNYTTEVHFNLSKCTFLPIHHKFLLKNEYRAMYTINHGTSTPHPLPGTVVVVHHRGTP
jgi:hypothetical protein